MSKEISNQKATDNDCYTSLSADEKFELQKKFLLEQFDYDELKKAGFFKDIKRKEYQKQIDKICHFFGYKTIFEFGWETMYAHISYAEGERPEGEPFLTEFKAWHES